MHTPCCRKRSWLKPTRRLIRLKVRGACFPSISSSSLSAGFHCLSSVLWHVELSSGERTLVTRFSLDFTTGLFGAVGVCQFWAKASAAMVRICRLPGRSLRWDWCVLDRGCFFRSYTRVRDNPGTQADLRRCLFIMSHGQKTDTPYWASLSAQNCVS